MDEGWKWERERKSEARGASRRERFGEITPKSRQSLAGNTIALKWTNVLEPEYNSGLTDKGLFFLSVGEGVGAITAVRRKEL